MEPSTMESSSEQSSTPSLTPSQLHVARVYELQYLVRRFDIQLRYGCTNPHCTTTTCLSYQRRRTDPPGRRPSPLTSRIMAYELAARSDAYALLCSNCPVMLPQQLNLPLETYKPIAFKKGPVQVKLVTSTWSETSQGTENLPIVRKSQAKNEATLKNYWISNIRLNPGTQPDRKSLSQNLFCTKTMLCFFWEPQAVGDFGVMRSVLYPQRETIKTMSLELHPPTALSDSQEQVSPGTPSTESDVPHLENLSCFWGQSIIPSSRNDSVSETNGPDLLSSTFGTATGLSQLFKTCFAKEEVDLLYYVKIFDRIPIFFHLSKSIQSLFAPPPNWKDTSTIGPYMQDEDAIHMLQLCIFALFAAVYPKSRKAQDLTWSHTILANHLTGNSYESRWLSFFDLSTSDRSHREEALKTLDAYRNKVTLELAIKIVRAIGARRAFAEAQSSPGSPYVKFTPFLFKLLQALEKFEGWAHPFDDSSPSRGISPVLLFQCWLVHIIKNTGPNEISVSRWQARGAAIELLRDVVEFWEMHQRQSAACRLENHWTKHSLPYLHKWIVSNMPYPTTETYLESIEASILRLPDPDAKLFLHYIGSNWEQNPNILHTLSLPLLFDTTQRIHNFRVLNYSRMLAAYRKAGWMEHLSERLYPTPTPSQHRYLHSRLEKAKSRYLLLDVRRDHLLEDAFDQLWGRERRELMRPLKIRMGMDFGEAGVDQGGISQEFFRLVFQKAFDPDTGLFKTTEDGSGYTWFQPNSHEPSSTYQLLGLLVALGVYNGLTLPLSFPLVFYKQLVGDKHGVGHSFSKGSSRFLRLCRDVIQISDGWPSFCNSLRHLFKSNEQQIADLCLDWTFTYEANGQRQHIDLYQWATTKDESGQPRRVAPSEETPPVTIANIREYVASYIAWLTHESVKDQLNAFMCGFKTVIDAKALAVVTPKTLQRIVEGTPLVDVDELAEYTEYEGGYNEHHPLILNFWRTVRDFPPEKHKTLLKFVTATDRLPAQGIKSLPFSVVRSGPDSDQFPTSSTCFGKLYLPEYATREKLEEKLDFALENSFGFGAA